jgi:16S rRNA (adenine1518-N6/adenine1519-N6)-dimethyltransferase
MKRKPRPELVKILPPDEDEPEVVEAVPEAPQEEPPNAQSPRQTLKYLRDLMQAYGLHPKAKLGQNFLIDLNLIELAVREAEVTKEDAVLEVGTGTGSLTGKIADRAGCVFTVEIDRDFHGLAKQILADRENVHLHYGDALSRKSIVDPEVLQGWQDLAKKFNCTRFKLVANLPYVVATPIISNLLLGDIPIDRMVVMVQWEIAERLRATVSTKDYNALSVLVQSLAEVETVRKVLPGNFFPRPKVDSAIVMIKPSVAKRAIVGDVLKFRYFLRDLYTHRRKNLRQALSGWPSGRRDKVEIDAKLVELGIDGSLRAEALDLGQHLALCQVFG